jgi:hypothetical protein
MPLQILEIRNPAILKDAALQQELDREGIVHFPFLPEAALKDLIRLNTTAHPEPPKGCIENFYVSTHSADLEYKLKIEAEISRILGPVCEEHFKDYTINTSAIIIKHPSPESKLGLHQDWTVVDESQFASYGIWIPLVDVTIENGAMLALKRSHRIGPTYRHTALPSVFSKIEEVAQKYLTVFEAKAGSIVLFNQALLHQSGANNSQQIRPSIVSTIVHKDARSLMYVSSTKANQLDAYEVKQNYVQYFDSFFTDSVALPKGAVKTDISVEADFEPMEPTYFEQLHQQLYK